jgi:hypothetical protein
MRAIEINFAPPGWRRVVASMRLIHWGLSAFGLLLCISGIVLASHYAQQNELRQTELAKANSAVRVLPVVKKAALTDEQMTSINSAIGQLNLPWSQLFKAIELATPSTVALLELVPDAKNHQVKGIAEAETPEMMLTYIQKLKEQEFLGNVILTKHEVSEQVPNGALRFEFEAEWLEGGR